MPADDLTDPAPATTFAHLDATTVLSRSIAELGIYPAVDPLDSKSRMLDPRIVSLTLYVCPLVTDLILNRSEESIMMSLPLCRRSSKTTSHSRYASVLS